MSKTFVVLVTAFGGIACGGLVAPLPSSSDTDAAVPVDAKGTSDAVVVDATLTPDSSPPADAAVDSAPQCAKPVVAGATGTDGRCKVSFDWTCGTTAYRMFGVCIPFSGSPDGSGFSGECDQDGTKNGSFQNLNTSSCSCTDFVKDFATADNGCGYPK